MKKNYFLLWNSHLLILFQKNNSRFDESSRNRYFYQENESYRRMIKTIIKIELSNFIRL